jgi:hypothetical protein
MQPSPQKLLDQVRDATRVRHYYYRTCAVDSPLHFVSRPGKSIFQRSHPPIFHPQIPDPGVLSCRIGPLANSPIRINWVMSDWAKIETVLRGQAFMVSDELGMQLHDRETIGESLTAQEKAQLEAWYT